MKNYQRKVKNQKRQNREIIERINIKEIESEIFDETKALEKIERRLSKLETAISKKRFWNEINVQETLETLKIKTKTEKLKKVDKMEWHKRHNKKKNRRPEDRNNK